MRRFSWFASCIPVAILIAGGTGGAATIRVDPSGAGDFNDVQPALDAAATGDTVLVAPGDYLVRTPINFNRVLGAGRSTKNFTVKSEGGAAVTVLRMSDEPLEADRASVVVFENGEGPSSVLDGFTLTGGQGSSFLFEGQSFLGGGGVLVDRSSPTIVRCRIAENRSAGYAGGLYCLASSPRLEDCIVEENSCIYDGGGMFSEDFDSFPVLVRCTFSGNRAGYSAGGWYLSRGNSSAVDCTFSGNRGKWGAGGIECDQGMTLERCSITGNWTDWQGGGLKCYWLSDAKLIDCTLAGNRARMGGAVCTRDTARVALDRCRIEGNWGANGGAFSLWESTSATITNCVIAGNLADGDLPGSVICSQFDPDWGWGDPITVVNCTISGNRAVAGDAVSCVAGHPVILRNSIVWGNESDAVCGDISHCLSEDPRFLKSGAFDFGRFRTVSFLGVEGDMPDFIVEPPDYRLAPGSPAIDAGDAGDAPATDIDGQYRPCGRGIDVGAYEAGSCTPPRDFRRGDANADGELDVTDAIAVLSYMFLGDPPALPCAKSADVDGSGELDISDPIHFLVYVFMGGQKPAPPFPDCGREADPGPLACERFPPCD